MSYFLTFKTIDTVSLQFAEADSELVELIMMTNVFSNSKQTAWSWNWKWLIHR